MLSNNGSASTLSMSLDGVSLGSTLIGPGVGTLKVPLHLTGKQQVLTLKWSGQPVPADSARMGLGSGVAVYLMVSRPQF